MLGSNDIQEFCTSESGWKNNNILKYKHQINNRLNSDIFDYLGTSNETSFKNTNPLNNFHHKFRKVPKNPCKVLDAPALQDDFYLNLIDWSHDNQLAVGLGNCIYLWNAETSKVTKLC